MSHYLHSYLSRAYASVGDALHFQRANDTARRLSTYLAPDFSQDEDEVYYTLGSILAERSSGYLVGQSAINLLLRCDLPGSI
jgi:hypothetical protein